MASSMLRRFPGVFPVPYYNLSNALAEQHLARRPSAARPPPIHYPSAAPPPVRRQSAARLRPFRRLARRRSPTGHGGCSAGAR